MQTYDQYIVANRVFQVNGTELTQAIRNMPGFDSFLVKGNTSTPCFQITYTEVTQTPTVKALQYEFGSEGVSSTFSSTEEGYLLHMTHDDGSQLKLWTISAHHIVYITGCLMPQMLRFALWMAYGIMNVVTGRIPIHGSCIVNSKRAYLFLGESGTGKSTHTRLWREYIDGSTLLNDDSPIIATEADGVWIYGSPWSGKTPCYKQEKYRLCGCVRLSQAPFNDIKRLSILHAYAALHPSCPPELAYDSILYEGISESLNLILKEVPIFHLACLPNEDAARLSYETLSKNGN